MQVVVSYVIAILTVALLGFFAYQNKKQGWRRERHNFLQDLAELEYVVYGHAGQFGSAATERPVKAETEARAEAALRLLIRGVRENATGDVPVSPGLTADLLKLEQLVGRRDPVFIAERSAEAIAAHQRSVATQLEESSEQAALRLRAVSHASRTLDLLLDDLDLDLYDAGVRSRIENLRRFMSEFAEGTPANSTRTHMVAAGAD